MTATVPARETHQRICDLTGLAPLHSDADGWFRQLFTAPLKADTDLVALKERIYNEYRIEVPLIDWNGYKLIRVSIQGYNSQKDVDALLSALRKLL